MKEPILKHGLAALKIAEAEAEAEAAKEPVNDQESVPDDSVNDQKPIVEEPVVVNPIENQVG